MGLSVPEGGSPRSRLWTDAKLLLASGYMSLDVSAVLPSRSGCQAVSDHKPPVSQLQSYPVSRVTAWSFSSYEEVFPGGGGALPWQRVTQFPAESETVPDQAGPCIRMAVPVWYLRGRQVFCG